MKESILVGIGGFIGSVARYLCSAYYTLQFPDHKFPLATFAVNLIGCLLIGLLSGLAAKYSSISSELRYAGMIGLVGGFTTFSSFSMETIQLFRAGEAITALIYIGSSVVFGIFLVFLGLKLV